MMRKQELDVTELVWRKSTRSNGDGECVEVAPISQTAQELQADIGAVAIRDSKDPDGGVLQVDPNAFENLMGEIKRDEHDL